VYRQKILHFFCLPCSEYHLKTHPHYRAMKRRAAKRRKEKAAKVNDPYESERMSLRTRNHRILESVSAPQSRLTVSYRHAKQERRNGGIFHQDNAQAAFPARQSVSLARGGAQRRAALVQAIGVPRQSISIF
jgi:hypothetical protein